MILFIDKETECFSARAVAVVSDALSIGIVLRCMFEKTVQFFQNSFLGLHCSLQLQESAAKARDAFSKVLLIPGKPSLAELP